MTVDQLTNQKQTMGKGDPKSRRGKIAKGTYGNRRPHKSHKAAAATEKKKSEK